MAQQSYNIVTILRQFGYRKFIVLRFINYKVGVSFGMPPTVLLRSVVSARRGVTMATKL